MGAWGTSLYANDSASDIRGDYVDQLRRGAANEAITKAMIADNQEIMGDVEEEPLFWFALADTQWNYGRLLPEVKEKALYFLSRDEELERWKEAGPKKLEAWKKTLQALQEKLLSPQPPEKKVSKYRLYQCKWKLGDVFAYQLSSQYSAEKGLKGKFVVFRKVSEDGWWPGHVIPVVEIYKWMGDAVPSMDMLSGFGLLPVNPPSPAYKKNDYRIDLICESEKKIPAENLTWIGNLPGDDLTPYCGYDFWTGYDDVGWESSKYNMTIEHHVIDRYLEWREIQI